jgi:UDP-N-acetylmuramoylalanine--D-glutamate ligase
MIPEYASARVSPHVAVITSLTSAASQETRGAFGILEYQTYNNFIVAPNDVIDAIKKQKDFTPKAKMLRTPGNNAALATQTAELFKVSPEVIQNVVATFSGLRGRQELIKKMEGIEFYNDAASVVPHSTLAALKVLATEKNAILIMGGAYTGYDYGELIRELPSYAKAVILLPGSGSLGVRDSLERLMDIAYFRAQHLEDAVILAKGQAKRGDRIIFSPGCEAIGIDSSRRERAERFVKAVRLL